jgi:hypothetical protein
MARLSKKAVNKCVDDFGIAVVKRARGNLRSEKAMSSGTLSKSIKYTWKKSVLLFWMEPYGTWLDKGVSGTGKLFYSNGKFLPVAFNKSEAKPEYSFKSNFKAIGGSLKSWLRNKGMDESLDFVMRRSVHSRGIRPRRFFSSAFDQELRRFDKCLGDAVNIDIDNTLDNILKNQ